MRKRTNSPKGADASRPSTGGQKTFRKSNDGAGRSFTKSRPEVESRFSKPSIKKSSLRPASRSENNGQSARPNYDHEKAPSERPRFDKPRFSGPGADKSGSERPRSFQRAEGAKDGRSPREFNPANRNNPERPRFEKRGDDKPFNREARTFKPRENFNPREKSTGDRPDRPRYGETGRSKDERSSVSKSEFERKDRPARPDADERPRSSGYERPARDFKPAGERSFDRTRKPAFKKKDELNPDSISGEENTARTEDRSGVDRRVGRFESAPRYNLAGYEKKGSAPKPKEESNEIRLNRYIANAGICSRREADDLISSGQISVNGKTITEMGYKVRPTDVVKYGKKALNPEKMVYILINKPKHYITTTDDPEERKTVLDLITGACSERIYPVGRLDRNTTGLLLMTNDGELAEKLTHPSGGIKKIYQAELDKPITNEDFELLQAGLELEDGFIRPDEVGLVTPDAMVVGLEIHSGRNRIVRRMFEHLGYEVQKLDRTVFAGLNKKDLPRGKWRFLSEKEVIKLKYML